MGAISQTVLKFHLSKVFYVTLICFASFIKNKNILKILYESKVLSKSVHSTLYSISSHCRVGVIPYVLFQLYRLTN